MRSGENGNGSLKEGKVSQGLAAGFSSDHEPDSSCPVWPSCGERGTVNRPLASPKPSHNLQQIESPAAGRDGGGGFGSKWDWPANEKEQTGPSLLEQVTEFVFFC